ncbi:MAG TPA: CHAT domain-containing protein [Candidatus Acidoferrales bacterium]|nr:CHAT domain-containing protein [Candidatus Acidoferrales bacterium]
MARNRISRSALLCAVLAAVLSPCFAQQQQQNSSAPASPGAQSIPSNDPRAQIDELLKQSFNQINVEVQFQKAAESAQQALDLSLKIGDKARACTAMVYLSAAYGYGGRLAESYEITEKLVVLARETGDSKILEQALNSAGGTAGGLGRYEDALKYLYECLAVARNSKDETMEYMSLLNIGEAYVDSGDPDRAESPLKQSLALAAQLKPDPKQSNKSKKGTEMALLNLGSMEAERRRYRPALAYYERVHASQPESQLWVIAALQGMADAHEHLAEPKVAIELLQQAIPLAEKAASGAQVVRLTSQLGVNQEMVGDLNSALASQQHALSLVHQRGGDPDFEWQIDGRIGRVQRALGRNDEALEAYRNSIARIEMLRSVAVSTEEGRAGVLERSRATYAEIADLLFDMHREAEALEIAERARARAFLEVLAESRGGVDEDLGAEQHKQEDSILARISAAQKQLWKENASPEERKQSEASLTAAETELENFQRELRRTNPRYASVRYPQPADIAEIQSKLLQENSVFVEFLLGEKRSLAWAVTKDHVTTVVLSPRHELESDSANYRKLLSRGVSTLTLQSSLSELNVLGAKLYRSLLQPLAPAIGSRQTILLVPDGGLQYLPFEALITDPGRGPKGSGPRYLAEKAIITYGPSASALLAVGEINRAHQQPPKTLVAFGDPVVPSHPATGASHVIASVKASSLRAIDLPPATDLSERGFSLTPLPYTRQEVLAIGSLFPAAQRRLFLGREDREEAVKSEKLDDYRYIHFASHGLMDELRPGRSGILFSPSLSSSEPGFLQVNDILHLKLNADLVTLSACSTGLGRLVSGEGILGLTRAFFYAGARNVVVSLWNVNDSATAVLMKEFYANLNRGLDEKTALQQAKLRMLRNANPLWRHPYYWAPFVLVGEGKPGSGQAH